MLPAISFPMSEVSQSTDWLLEPWKILAVERTLPIDVEVMYAPVHVAERALQ